MKKELTELDRIFAFFAQRDIFDIHIGTFWVNVNAGDYITHRDTLIELYSAVKKNRPDWLLSITEKYYSDIFCKNKTESSPQKKRVTEKTTTTEPII